jgi:hypothetical protein
MGRTAMDDERRERDGRNVFQMIHAAGGVGIWVRRTTWDGTVARIVGMSAPNGPPPYFGSPKVVMDVFGLDGSQRDELAHLSTAGTYKTWRQVDPPAWAGQAKLRHLDDPKIAAALGVLAKNRSVMAEGRLDLNVPYDRRNEAKSLGARWDPIKKIWWLPADASGPARDKARTLGFLKSS